MARKESTVITRDDLENKLRAFQGDIQGRVDERKQGLVSAGASIGLIMLIIVFLLGRRSGRKKTTFVEIKRL